MMIMKVKTVGTLGVPRKARQVDKSCSNKILFTLSMNTNVNLEHFLECNLDNKCPAGQKGAPGEAGVDG